MHLHWCIVLMLGITVYQTAVAQQTADKAANSKTKSILSLIASMPQKGKVLSGQFAGYSPDTFSSSIMDQTKGNTGKTPAIMACDWSCGWNTRSPPESIIDYSCNSGLKAHWNKGGLVTVNMHLPNPANSNGGGYKERGSLNFRDLLDGNTQTGQRWYRFLDRMALGLDDLQRAGVTVLFRPLHEMNGDWFYWCNQDAEVYKNVWRNMFYYLTNTKNLHNLLWIYSPDQSRDQPARYYPGNDFVDIVALDAYVDEPINMKGYDEMIALNKPFALGEVGPSNINGGFDYMKWINAIQTKFPKITYFLAWNDEWAPIKNRNGASFLQNSKIVNLEELSSVNSGGSSGTQTGTGGSTVLHNFSRGIGQWKGTGLVGGPWQVNDQTFRSTDSIKADIRLTANGRSSIFTQEKPTVSLTGNRRLTVQARVASWGVAAGGKVSAKLYMKLGGSWKWYDSGEIVLSNSAFSTLAIDLTKIPSAELADVKEMGVDFISSSNGSQTSVYIAYVSLEA